MNSVQPWMVVAGSLAGLAVGGAVASGWWWAKLKRARRLIDRIESSRQLLNEQTTQARRQIERMQMELGELRLIAERMRRKAALAAVPHDSQQDAAESILPLDSVSPVSAPSPLSSFRPIEKPRAPEPPVDLAAQRAERARERAAEGGFARTEIQDSDAAPRGFAPTQLDKPF
ncbi:hypothetical protein [Mitsuaria sp. GD03876]|uniref:hypothetical protein n=1 Tax=Mitsuaria sp. GD03876 TaxID=2975399 RepID=UPI00244AF146|nr:hypothetical protein [Mitsuaria sp. GD03876]MDH0865212.1 hypothetical protein [Mitsuaria sp. GD03876]